MSDMTIALESVLPIEEHVKLIWKWRCDPKIVQMSRHRAPIEWKSFWENFVLKYCSIPKLQPFFANINGKKVAFASFSPCTSSSAPFQTSCEISIMCDPEEQGKGIGTKFLKLVTEYAERLGFTHIYAEIRPENFVSRKMFEHENYQFIEEIAREIIEDGKVEKIPLFLYCRSRKTQKKPVFIIAEIGSNWRVGEYEHDLFLSKTLIDLAKDADADAVKFQTFQADKVYVQNAGKSDYLEKTGHVRDIQEIFKDLEMPHKMIEELFSHCQKVGIEFMSTPFSVEDFYAVDPYVKRHKIASYELSHIRLLECAAQSGKPVIMSTGASSVEEIAWAITVLKNNGCQDITLLQCTAQYPAEDTAMNLLAISSLHEMFNLPCGLSDHSIDPCLAPFASVALGASVIEKHFTLDNRLSGPDHAFAITPDGLKTMISGIRRIEAMLGNGNKRVLEQEKELYSFAKRRVQATNNIVKGEILLEGENIDILRPGKQKPGLHPSLLPGISGKKATRSIPLGDGIQYGDF